jgi:hypothetical protein
MVLLGKSEIEWLRENFPQLSYNSRKNEIVGKLSFCKKYKELKAIKETYAVRIDFSSMRAVNSLPKVYNTDDRIKRYAKIRRVNPEDFHLCHDDSLCLILPLKIKDRYPHGFRLSIFIEDLTNYLYWVTYKSRYNIEPWQGEAHRTIANLLNYIENPTKYLNFFVDAISDALNIKIKRREMQWLLENEIEKRKQKGELC